MKSPLRSPWRTQTGKQQKKEKKIEAQEKTERINSRRNTMLTEGLTAELKETHLGTSSSSDKSRSASTSTITQNSLDKTASASTSTLVQGDGTATSTSPEDASLTSTVKPGLLIVTLHEAKGLTLPPAQAGSSQRPPSSGGTGGNTSRPGTSNNNMGHSRHLSKLFRTYCVLEFDKTQVVVNANSGVPDAPMFAGGTTQFKFDVSREAELSVGIYMRNPGPRGAGDEDVFLGSCRILPSFEEPVQGAKKQQPARGLSGTEWVPFSNSSGSVKIGVEYRRNQDMPLSMSDFDLMTVVGKGSFGKVMQVKYVAMPLDAQRLCVLTTE